MGTLCFFLSEEATEMAIVKTNDQYYNDIAAAIRSKNGESALYYPSQMAQKILDIPSGGGSIDLDQIIFNGIIQESRYLNGGGGTQQSNRGLWTAGKKTRTSDASMEDRHLYGPYTNMVSTSTTHVKVGCRFYSWVSSTTTFYVARCLSAQSNIPEIYTGPSTKIIRATIKTSTGSTYTVGLDTLVELETWYMAVAEWEGTSLSLSLYDENGALLETKSVTTSGTINTSSIMNAYYTMGSYASGTTMPRVILDLHNCFIEVNHVMIRGMNEMRK